MLWQMDVTHVPSFGKLSYVHCSMDTYSGMSWATALSGKKAFHVIQHLYEAFNVLQFPQQIKTDNASAYMSMKLQNFFKEWNIQRSTGIPYNPQGQAIIERSHRISKDTLQKQKGGDKGSLVSPRVRLCSALSLSVF